jgi:hypothetical protein
LALAGSQYEVLTSLAELENHRAVQTCSQTLEAWLSPLPAYEVDYDAAGGDRSEKLLGVGKPTVFETPFVPGQMRLFGLAETLGEEGWLKVFRLEDYAPRRSPSPGMLQLLLIPYGEAWG